MKPLSWVFYITTAVGALNWGLVKLFNFNLVDTLLSWISLTGFGVYIYGAIGLAGAYGLYTIYKPKSRAYFVPGTKIVGVIR